MEAAHHQHIVLKKSISYMLSNLAIGDSCIAYAYKTDISRIIVLNIK